MVPCLFYSFLMQFRSNKCSKQNILHSVMIMKISVSLFMLIMNFQLLRINFI